MTDLLAVGFPLGAWDPAGPIEPSIRLGAEVVTVSPDEYDVWWQARFIRSADRLRAWARSQELSDPDAVVPALVEAGLLADGRSLAFTGGHRLVPAGVGGGVVEAEGGEVSVLLCDYRREPMLSVDPTIYRCWAVSDGLRSLAEVCAYATAWSGLDSARVRGALVGALPAFVELGLGTLDRLVR